jgi:hypothetical protein
LSQPGHVFASKKEVEQATSCFLEAWAIHGFHDGKKITCHFGVSGKKKKPSQIAPGMNPHEPAGVEILALHCHVLGACQVLSLQFAANRLFGNQQGQFVSCHNYLNDLSNLILCHQGKVLFLEPCQVPRTTRMTVANPSH